MLTMIIPLMAAIRAEWPNNATQSNTRAGCRPTAPTKAAVVVPFEDVLQSSRLPAHPPGMPQTAESTAFGLASGLDLASAFSRGGLPCVNGTNCLHTSSVFSSIYTYTAGTAVSLSQRVSPLVFANWMTPECVTTALSVPLSEKMQPKPALRADEWSAGLAAGLFGGGQLEHRQHDEFSEKLHCTSHTSSVRTSLQPSGSTSSSGVTSSSNAFMQRKLRGSQAEGGIVSRRRESLGALSFDAALSSSGLPGFLAYSPVCQAGASPP